MRLRILALLLVAALAALPATAMAQSVDDGQASGGGDDATATAQADGDELPATGFPSEALVAAGFVLLGGGVAMRRAAVRLRA